MVAKTVSAIRASNITARSVWKVAAAVVYVLDDEKIEHSSCGSNWRVSYVRI